VLEIVCRLLLLAHPPRFRREFGGEIERLVRDRARAARGERWLSRAGNAADIVADLAISAPREWRAAWQERRTAAQPHVAGRGRRGKPMRDLLFDVRYALRVLAARPAFTLAALATLAVGIGANTAIYSLADRTLLHPLPVAGLDRLVSWSWASSYPDFEDYLADDRTFSGLLAEAGLEAVSVSAGGRTELVSADLVSAGYFTTLGVSPAAGRLLGAADDVAGGPLVVVLSHGYWQRRFGGDPSAVGSTIRLNGSPATVVGVAARGFRGLSLRSSPDVWAPLRPGQVLASSQFLLRPDLWTSRGVSWLKVYGRLRPGVSPVQAAAAMDAVYRERHPPRPGQEPERLVLHPLRARALGLNAVADLERFVLLLGGVVVFALLIACANVANMLLVRATERRHEVGVRLALGASRGRLLRQFMTESLLLGTCGGLLGLAVAWGLLGVLSAYQLPGGVPIADMNLTVDGAVATFGVGLSVATSLVFGLLPAWSASAARPTDAMRALGRAVTGSGRVRAVLVAAQVALCLVLLAGMGLFSRALQRALAIDLGFEAGPVAVGAVNPGLERLTPAQMLDDFGRVVERLQAIPGVESAAWSSAIPMRGTIMSDFQVEGYEPAADEEMYVLQNYVWTGYFKTLGIRLTRGRPFTATDGPGAPKVVIVNDAFARRYLPGVDPLGRHVTTGWDEPYSAEIVGVVADSHWHDLQETPAPFVYLPFPQVADQIGSGRAWLVVRAPNRAEAIAGRLAAEVSGVDDRLASYRIGTYEQILAERLMPQRMGLMLLGLFGTTALLLAAVGIQGVASYVVTQRRREIGIRIALGAEPGRVRALVLRQSLVPIAIGLGLGLIVTGLASPLAERFLYGLNPLDPLTLALVAVGLAALATLAGDLPARRAMRVDPAETLRVE